MKENINVAWDEFVMQKSARRKVRPFLPTMTDKQKILNILRNPYISMVAKMGEINHSFPIKPTNVKELKEVMTSLGISHPISAYKKTKVRHSQNKKLRGQGKEVPVRPRGAINATPVTRDVPARMVMYQYGYDVPEGLHIHHKNGIHSDNRIENLTFYDPRRHQEYHLLKDPEARTAYSKMYEQVPNMYNLDMTSDVYDKFYNTKFPKPVETLDAYNINQEVNKSAKTCGLSPKDKLYAHLANDSRNTVKKKVESADDLETLMNKAWYQYVRTGP